MLAYLQSQHSGQRDKGLPSNLAIQTRQISELWIQVGNHPSTGMMQSIQEETQHQYLAGTCTHINMHLYTHVPTHMKIHLHTLRYTHTRVHSHIYIKKNSDLSWNLNYALNDKDDNSSITRSSFWWVSGPAPLLLLYIRVVPSPLSLGQNSPSVIREWKMAMSVFKDLKYIENILKSDLS